MLAKKFMNQIRVQILDYSKKRRQIIKTSSDVLHWSKKAIFSLQRDDLVTAKELISKAEKVLDTIYKQNKKDARLLNEGSLKAALEEYVEAVLFNQFVNNKQIGLIAKIKVNEDVYLGGLCDVPGELLRYAIKSATERNFVMVKKCYATAEEIIGATMDMNLTGYNRQKFDQAKSALNKLQHIMYETSMKDS